MCLSAAAGRIAVAIGEREPLRVRSVPAPCAARQSRQHTCMDVSCAAKKGGGGGKKQSKLAGEYSDAPAAAVRAEPDGTLLPSRTLATQAGS
jgi:hypothetical protein